MLAYPLFYKLVAPEASLVSKAAMQAWVVDKELVSLDVQSRMMEVCGRANAVLHMQHTQQQMLGTLLQSIKDGICSWSVSRQSLTELPVLLLPCCMLMPTACNAGAMQGWRHICHPGRPEVHDGWHPAISPRARVSAGHARVPGQACQIVRAGCRSK